MHVNPNVTAFMANFPGEALTYDDVTLVTQYADFLPDEASITSRLTSRININAPFISAAMDTVTESGMAIAMALNGGIGVIHKNLSAEEQARQVRKVKNHLNGLIQSPVCFHVNDTIEDIKRIDFLIIDDFADDVTLHGDIGSVLNNVLEIRTAAGLNTILVSALPLTDLIGGCDMRVSGKLGRAGKIS